MHDPSSHNTGTIAQSDGVSSDTPPTADDAAGESYAVSQPSGGGTGSGTIPQTDSFRASLPMPPTDLLSNSRGESRPASNMFAPTGTMVAGAEYDPSAVASGGSAEFPLSGETRTASTRRTHSDGDESPASQSRYRTVRPLAKGGMGQVLVAIDEELDRSVALKEIQPRFTRDRTVKARFVLEAQVTGRLEHPGVVPVYGLNYYPDGRPYYAMRFITGESLQDAVTAFHNAEGPNRDDHERTLALRGLLRRFIDVCNTIGYAHSRGILHRDLKPANVMLGAYGETLVVDWGLAKDLTATANAIADSTAVIPALAMERTPAPPPEPEPSPSVPQPASVVSPSESVPFDPFGVTGTLPQAAPPVELFDVTRTLGQQRPAVSFAGPAVAGDGELTEIGKAMGTPAFMAPEQADGRWDDVREAADIYSLGATLYAILCGHSPFRGNVAEILKKVMAGQMVPIRSQKKGLPNALVAVVEKAMALRPADRYPTALALASDIERWLADEPVSVYREPFTVRVSRWARRHRTIVLSIAATLGTGFLATGIGLVFVNMEKNRTAAAKKQTEEVNQQLEERNGELTTARGDTRDALFALTDDAIGEVLASQHAISGQQRKFLENVIGLYQRFVRDGQNRSDSQLFLAGAWNRIGRLHWRLGNLTEAANAYQQVFQLGTDKTDEAWTRTTGEARLYLGIQYISRGRYPQAVDELAAAREVFFRLVPTDGSGQPADWYRLGQAEERLGLAYYNQGKPQDAELWFRNSLENRRRLATREPNVLDYQFRVAQSLRQVAMVCQADGRRAEAVRLLGEAQVITDKLLATEPTSAVYLAMAASVDGLSAVTRTPEPTDPPLTKAVGKPRPLGTPDGSAQPHAQRAVDAWSKLVGLYPGDVGYQQQLAMANLNLAVAARNADQARPTRAALAAARLVLDDLDRRVPNDPTSRQIRSRVAHQEAVQLRLQDDLPSARRAIDTALQVTEKLVVEFPSNPRFKLDMGLYQFELAGIHLLAEQLPECERQLGLGWVNTVTAARGLAPSGPVDKAVWSNVRLYARRYLDLYAELKRPDQVEVVAKDIADMGVSTDDEKYEVACLYGRAATVFGRVTNLDEAVKAEWMDTFRTLGVTAVRELTDRPDRVRRLADEPDLVFVRSHPKYPK